MRRSERRRTVSARRLLVATLVALLGLLALVNACNTRKAPEPAAPSADDGRLVTTMATATGASTAGVGTSAGAKRDILFAGEFSELLSAHAGRGEVLLFREQTLKEPGAHAYVIVGADRKVRETFAIRSEGAATSSHDSVILLSRSLQLALARLERLARDFGLVGTRLLPFLAVQEGEQGSSAQTWDVLFASHGPARLTRGKMDECYELDREGVAFRRVPKRCHLAFERQDAIEGRSITGRSEEMFGLTDLCYFDHDQNAGRSKKLACCKGCRNTGIRCDDRFCGLFADQATHRFPFWIVSRAQGAVGVADMLYGERAVSFASNAADQVAILYRGNGEQTAVFDMRRHEAVLLRDQPSGLPSEAIWFDGDTLLIHRQTSGSPYPHELERVRMSDPRAWMPFPTRADLIWAAAPKP